jgi:hypothetical protein
MTLQVVVASPAEFFALATYSPASLGNDSWTTRVDFWLSISTYYN